MNPLTEIRFRIPFDQIRAEHVEPAINELLDDAQQRLDALAHDSGERTFENTLLALEDVTENLEFGFNVAGHLESVRTSDELRKAYNAVQPKVMAFLSSIPLNDALWKQLQAYAATDEAKQLEGVRARFLEKTLDEFRRSGADLGPEDKERLKAINVELSKITQKFSENVLDATNAFELIIEDEARLAGLPPSAVEAARESAEKKGKEGYRFTLQQPSYHAVMTYLDDAGVRETMWRAHATRAASGEHDNTGLMVRILELRREKARMLGYKDFADLVLEDRMAKNGARAQEFVAELTERTRKPFRRENEELRAFRMSIEGASAVHMDPWDVPYYAEKLRKREYDFDEEDLRPYFAYNDVMAGMFEVVRRLYGVRGTPEPDAPVWHEDVRCYSISDEDGAKLGSFYVDYFPREDKRGGAWMDHLITGQRRADGEWEPHLGLMCGNLNPPVAGKPALLTHRDVETLFHEFGHLLHHLFARVEIRSLAGTNVAWDFVELPSQIMENWCWEREALDLFAKHYETGEKIPDDLFQKMKRARNFRSANHQMRQLSFGTLDLKLHIEYDPETDGDVLKYSYRILRDFAPTPLPRYYAMPAAFSHLFASPVGYGAGYYSYKWSEALDADAFTRFAKEGVFRRETGEDFRRKILEKGDSEKPEKLFRDFMGRDPDPEALLVRLGLAA